MTDFKRVAGKVWFWANHEALVGLVLLAVGLYIGRDGYLKLRELWGLFSGLFPLHLQEDIGERVLNSLPVITTVFVSTVSSVAAVLMGAAWAVTGFFEFVQRRGKTADTSALKDPALVAEIVRTGESQYWRGSVWPIRMVGRLWARARFISPVSFEMLGDLWRSCWRVFFIGILIFGVHYGLHLLPSLLERYLNLRVVLLIPSAKPLYFLLGFVLLVYALTALSLMPFRRGILERCTDVLAVKGQGDPHAFFALLEEGFKLLSAKGTRSGTPFRLESEQDPQIRATLVETSPEPLRSIARPAAYFCLPLVFLLMTMGFSRLVHFQRPAPSMPYQEFLAKNLLGYSFEAAFAIGLIIIGIHFSSQARKLFRIRVHRSGVVLAQVTGDPAALDAVQPDGANGQGIAARDVITWKSAEGADDRFAEWVRAPHGNNTFRVIVYWAEAISEGATAEGPRYLITLRKSIPLDAAMAHIVQLPFNVAFDADATDSARRTAAEVRAEPSVD